VQRTERGVKGGSVTLKQGPGDLVRSKKPKREHKLTKQVNNREPKVKKTFQLVGKRETGVENSIIQLSKGILGGKWKGGGLRETPRKEQSGGSQRDVNEG